MKTIEQLQAAVDEIRGVCNRHGIVLVGSCFNEGIDGDIQVIDASCCREYDKERLTNKVVDGWHDFISVDGIGDAE